MATFVGHTRFSLFSPSSGQWRATQGGKFPSPEAYRDYLYSDDRLALRTWIFLDLCLSNLARWSGDHELILIVSYSTSLPQKWKQALEAAARRYDFLVLDMLEETDTVDVIQTYAVDRAESLGIEFAVGEAVGVFRVDDDDVLCSGFLDRVGKYVTAANGGMLVSLGLGVTAISEGNVFYFPRIVHEPTFSAGLTSIFVKEASGEWIRPATAGHENADRSNPVILDSQDPGFFWVRHRGQDTSLWSSNRSPVEQRIVLREAMQDTIPMTDLRVIDRYFPSVHGHVSLRADPEAVQQVVIQSSKKLKPEGSHFGLSQVEGEVELFVTSHVQEGGSSSEVGVRLREGCRFRRSSSRGHRFWRKHRYLPSGYQAWPRTVAARDLSAVGDAVNRCAHQGSSRRGRGVSRHLTESRELTSLTASPSSRWSHELSRRG